MMMEGLIRKSQGYGKWWNDGNDSDDLRSVVIF